jgi:ribonucleoside-diphosphate reductase alpha chain
MEGKLIRIEKGIVGWRVEDACERTSDIVVSHAPKRPLVLTCDIHKANIKGENWTILVGMLKGVPYEVMGGLSQYIDIPQKYSSGELIKNPRKTINARYDLKFGENGDEVLIKDIVSVFDNPNYGSLTRMISVSMRHGVPMQYIVEQLQKDNYSDMFSFSRVVARVLKKYIEDGTRPGSMSVSCNCEIASECNFIYQSGCISCTSCGYSACG